MTKGALTRERIVAHAAPIFNRRGFEGTSLSDLMAATGLQKGGIYRHFKNKEELALAAFEHAWRNARRERWRGIDKNAGAIDQLKQFVTNFVEKRPGLVSGGCPVLNTAVDCDDGNAALRDQALKLWSNRLREIAQAGIVKGEIQPDADAGQIATIIISTLEGAFMIARLQRSELPLQPAQAHLTNFLDHARASLNQIS